MTDLEAKEAAELKAKLAMVSTLKKPKHGRRSRVIGEMVCNTGVKSGFHKTWAKFVLRLDSNTGEFIAEHGDMWYVSKSRDALRARMDLVARVTVDLKWTRYLKVDYEATVQGRGTWNTIKTIEIDDDRDDNNPVFGVCLAWTVVEYSDLIMLPGTSATQFMKRSVDDDGNVSDDQEIVGRLPAGLVAYTKEREDTLRRLRMIITAMDAWMVELFNHEPDGVSKRLDEMSDVNLLQDLVGAAGAAKCAVYPTGPTASKSKKSSR